MNAKREKVYLGIVVFLIIVNLVGRNYAAAIAWVFGALCEWQIITELPSEASTNAE